MNTQIKVSDFDIYECYLEEMRRKLVAASLLTFGHFHFNRALIIKKLDALIEFNESERSRDFPTAKHFIKDFIFESLIDSIKIGICFENYFKAKLLLNGISIHVINNTKNKELHKIQRKRPIFITELISTKNKEDVPILKQLLRESSLNYSLLLENQEYFKFFNLEKRTLIFLSELNKKRNKLHLNTSEKIQISTGILANYSELKRIINHDMAILQNTLLIEIDPESESKIPVQLG